MIGRIPWAGLRGAGDAGLGMGTVTGGVHWAGLAWLVVLGWNGRWSWECWAGLGGAGIASAVAGKGVVVLPYACKNSLGWVGRAGGVAGLEVCWAGGVLGWAGSVLGWAGLGGGVGLGWKCWAGLGRLRGAGGVGMGSSGNSFGWRDRGDADVLLLGWGSWGEGEEGGSS